ncbi:hypothetical protein [Heliobacterium chlorum]|uniref:hypothetical protein n=1 Tax=Heliobacterium chlorum TaxID=2698 RepID=UPI00165E150B|nr:hypothetical protein [Heliobacterium chlorum]
MSKKKEITLASSNNHLPNIGRERFLPMKSEAEQLLKLIHKKHHEASRLLLARRINQAIMVSREVDRLR